MLIISINNAQSVGYGQMWPAQIIHLAIACLPASDFLLGRQTADCVVNVFLRGGSHCHLQTAIFLEAFSPSHNLVEGDYMNVDLFRKHFPLALGFFSQTFLFIYDL